MNKAIVVLSGGQDSTTCLYWAKREFDGVDAVTFDYGQRHSSEIDAARRVAAAAGVGCHVVAPLEALGMLSPSALTRDVPVAATGWPGNPLLAHLPTTFTPGRNLVFLTLAASFAVGRGSADVVTGMCQTDYSGYPDCRRDT